ncbi:MAG: RAMP superfamily CRISPR-associated protein [Candidatus Nezhaarchaeales archaeon]
MKIGILIKSIGLAGVGWGFPWPTGADIAVFRRPVKTDGGVKYVMCIPATSFKGALRSAASRVARAYNFSSCGGICRSDLCDVCRLFGAPGMKAPSKLRVSDFYSDNAESFILTRIRINDSSYRVEKGGLFTEEYLLPGAIFTGEIDLPDDLDQNLIKLLLIGLAELRLGRLGRGFPFDLKICEPKSLEKIIDDAKWIGLLEDLGRWLWDEVI